MFSLAMLSELTADLARLSKEMQERRIDLIECCRQISMIKDKLARRQEEGDRTFGDVYLVTRTSK